MARRYPPPQSSSRSGGASYWQKMKTILVHFVPEKLPLVSKIVLNVIKCYVTVTELAKYL